MEDSVENYEGCNAMQSLRQEQGQRRQQVLKGTDSTGLLAGIKGKYSTVKLMQAYFGRSALLRPNL